MHLALSEMEDINNNEYRRIGQGFCGTVWASATKCANGYAIKREDGGPGRSLFNDYTMHQKISKCWVTHGFPVRVPHCSQYIYASNQGWWDEQIPRFPERFQVPCNALVTERIPAFPDDVRHTIVDRYCPEVLKGAIRTSVPDEDCLIRPYLGRRRRCVRQSRVQAFSLRNYPLHMDQIEDLKLDGALYARNMAETLANLFWRAHVDAADVEFVLAPPGHERHGNETVTIDSQALGRHVIWILDFDCCKEISLDEKGVESAVRAFCRNDPFYPLPGRENEYDKTLWLEFRDAFLKASGNMLDQESSEARLPALWVEMVERRAL